MDVHSRETRHYNMSQIKSKDTKPEKLVRSFLFKAGYRFRKNDRKLPGTPDVVLPRYHTVIFVNGCFWHGHDGCRFFVIPSTNTEFWVNKINQNKRRDEEKIHTLESMGWKVLVIWECQLRQDKRENTLNRLSELIGKS